MAVCDAICRHPSVPQAGLSLEFIYGYNGHTSTAPNIFYLADNRLVYYTAAVGVVYDPAKHTQQFYQVGLHQGKRIRPARSTRT